MRLLILVFLLGFQAFAADVDLNSSDYFKRLGLKSGASQQEIKSAFRSLAKIYHPDVRGTGNVQAMQKLAEAYEKLLASAPVSPVRESDFNVKENLVYKNMLANLRAKVSSSQIDKMGFDPLEFPITAFYYAIADISDWLLNGEDTTDSIDSIGRGLSPLNKLERLAVADFFNEVVVQNSRSQSQIDFELLLKHSRIDLLMSLLAKDFSNGEDMGTIKDILFSLKRVSASNQFKIAEALRYVKKMKAAAQFKSEKFDYLTNSLAELLDFYNQLDDSESCSDFLR